MKRIRQLAASFTILGTLLSATTSVTGQQLHPGNPLLSAAVTGGADSNRRVGVAGQAELNLRFSAPVEVLLPHPGQGQRPELYDFETGRRLLEPDREFFHDDAKANITWIKTNGLDISGFVLDPTNVVCIAYYLAAVPVEPQCWEKNSPADTLAHEGLARIRDPKRTLLSPGSQGTHTFLFRTREGSLGLLQLLGASADRRSVSIRYKLLQLSGAASPGQIAQNPIPQSTGDKTRVIRAEQ